jgi:hypothetical protein
VATEVVGLVALPLRVPVDSSREEWAGVETASSQIMSEPQVWTGSGDDDVVMVFVE